MKRLLFFFLLLFTLSTSFTQTTLDSKIYFDSDQYSLDASSINELERLISQTDGYTECSLHIIGHTDQDGSDAYNMDLSQKRAEVVKEYLKKNGLPDSSIEVSFQGESNLASESLDYDSKRMNRRVSIVATGYSYRNVKELVTQLEKDRDDKFTVENNTESKLNLSQGTEVTIPPNAFCLLDGTPLENDKVELTFKEAFDYLDMVDNRLFTQTDDRLLETGGMIFIEANQNGKPLKLMDGKSIELLFPRQELKEGMELFTGSEDENGIIWDETGEEITSVKDKADAPFIQVDMSALLNYQLEDFKIPSLNFAAMPKYPHPARISYPPYKENYSEEDYLEAVRKYEAVMAAHEADKITRPERLKEWIALAEERKGTLFEHKKNYVSASVHSKLKSNLERLKLDKDRISHDRLIDVLFSFLDREVGNVHYDEWPYVKKTFGGTVVDVRNEIGLDFPSYDEMSASRFFKSFMVALKEVKDNILQKKYEMGYVDEEVFSRYIVKSSKLGWINCDRFIDLMESEKMDFQFASTSKGDQYYLVFKNVKSLIRPNELNGKVSFNGVPIGEDVRLVGLRMNEGEAFLAKHDFKLGSKDGIKLAFSSAEVRDFKKALEI